MKHIFYAITVISICHTPTMADDSIGEAIGGAIGSAIGGLFGGIGAAACNATAIMPDIPELKTNTMTNVDTAWLQTCTFTQFCGIPLGGNAEIDYDFLKQISEDLNTKRRGYYYNFNLNAIVYEGEGRRYSDATGKFFSDATDIRVVITPKTHKVAGVYLNCSRDIKLAQRLHYKYGLKNIDVITSRPIIEEAFENAVGRKFFVESGDLNVGNGTQYLFFDTIDYPINNDEPNIKRKMSTGVGIVNSRLCKTRFCVSCRHIQRKAQRDRLLYGRFRAPDCTRQIVAQPCHVLGQF